MSILTYKNIINAYKHLIECENGGKGSYLSEMSRTCGYIEACLQNEGVLSPTEPLPRKRIIHNPMIGKRKYIREGYINMIKRICIEYFEDNNIDIENYEDVKD